MGFSIQRKEENCVNQKYDILSVQSSVDSELLKVLFFLDEFSCLSGEKDGLYINVQS